MKHIAEKEVDMRDDQCIFCKIANGDIPSRTIYEDEMFRVILDNGPATKGHALVLPKDHYADFYAMPEASVAKAFQVAQKVAVQIKENLGADGLNIVQNNGETAGQTVNHFHIHIIPRYKGDGQQIAWNPGSPNAEELDAILREIKR